MVLLQTRKGDAMRIAIYSRKSKFTGKGESIQNQIELCKEYANKHFEVEEIYIYEDEGFSGGNTDRPEFKRLVKDLTKKKFDTLICYRLDRISRNISDFSSTMELLEEHDINFVSIREQFDTSTPMGRAMMYITSVFAQLERETIAERIKDNMHQLARSGRWLGGKTPTGYESESIIYHDENLVQRKAYKLTSIQSELEIVNMIYDKYLEVQSLTQLESWTLEEGIKSKNNKNFDKSALKLILTNPVYCKADNLAYEYFNNLNAEMAAPLSDFDGTSGLMVFNKNNVKRKKKVSRKDESEWIIAVGKHKGIINSKDWITVQNMLKANSKKAPRTGTSKHGLITRFLRCKSCGSKMRISYRKVDGEVKNYYYKCLLKERSRKSQCDIINLNGSLADQIVINELKKIYSNRNNLISELYNRKNNIKELSKTQGSAKDNLEKEVNKYKESINNLTLQLAESDSSIASKYIIEQIENFHKKITEINTKLQELDEEKESTFIEQMNVDLLEESIHKLIENFHNIDFNEKKSLLNQIIEYIHWDGEHLEVTLLGQR
jgi:site-specific DNA recombinase